MTDNSDDNQAPPENTKKPYQRSRFVAEPEDAMFFRTREESDKWTAQRTAEIEAERQRILRESAERRKQAAAKSETNELMTDDSGDNQAPLENTKKPRQRSRFVAEPEDFMVFRTREESDKWTAQRTAEIEAGRQQDLRDAAERRKQAAEKSKTEETILPSRVPRAFVQILKALLGWK